jgi:diguanylate cyclase (GGDEF)-like protein
MFDSEVRVLIVEDNRAEAELVADLLARARRPRFVTEVAARLQEGVARLHAAKYDVVLLDFHLPDGEGPETYARVRDAAPEIPVVIVTNLDDDDAAEHAMRLGAQDYLLKKEVTAQLLARSLRYAIARERAERGRHRAEAQLAHDAIHDDLTGLPNRTLLRDRLTQALRRANRESAPCAVLFLDVDRFKNVNDSLGHAAGDQLLLQIAGRLEHAVRDADTVARLGGDEFAILAHDVAEVSDASHAAQRIADQMMRPFQIAGTEVYTGSSIGISLSDSGYRRADDMIRDAEIAMYRAKASGKNRYEVFDADMHRKAVALLQLETDLRRALERDEFVMHYQPIVSLAQDRLVGFEALVRWRHPQRGLVRPAQFIAVAEETGLIIPLAWRVLESAAAQISRWQSRYPGDPPLSMSANVSGKLFLQPDVVDRVVEILEAHRLDPGSLKLEITENVLMDHGDTVLPRLQELRALGVQLDIDDFGTGFSSLSYLQRFRYDTLKIDRSFISTLEHQGDSAAIVKTILALGATLDMNVIAEGVETADQARHLRDLRCPQGQGYWFAHPLSVEDVEELLDGRPAWRE